MGLIKINQLLKLYVLLISLYIINAWKEQIHSRFDIVEINDYKYDIDIEKAVKPESDLAILNENNSEKQIDIIKLRNIRGQAYECTLPKFGDITDEDDNDENFKKKDTSDSDKNSSPYNFTLIHDKVIKSMQKLTRSKLCIYRSLGWWTYEFCFGSHASQYHMLNNGSIEGEIISLGNFTTDYNWLKANESNFPISFGILYHEQYYEMGSICELTQKPRRVVAKIFCDAQSSTEIDLISEIETCIYEIHINSPALCHVPHFDKKQNKFDIKCNPVVDQGTYEKYRIKKEKAEEERKLKKEEELRLKQVSDSENKVSAYKNRLKLNKDSKKTNEMKNLIDLNFNLELDEHLIKKNIDEINEAFSRLSNSIDSAQVNENANNPTLASQNIEYENDDLKLKEKSKNVIKEAMKNIDASKLDSLNRKLLQQNKELFSDLKQSGVDDSDASYIEELIKNTEKTLDSISKKQMKMNDEKETDPEERDKYSKKVIEDSINPLNLNPFINDARSENNEESGSDLDLVSDKRTEKSYSFELIDDEALEKIKKSMHSSDPNQKYKIKVINIDLNDKKIDSDDLTSILSSLLKEESEIKNHEKMTLNYNYVYDSNAEIDDESEDTLQNPAKKSLSSDQVHYINYDNWLSEENKEKNEENELIIY